MVMRDFAFGVSAKHLSDFFYFFKEGVCLLLIGEGRVVIHIYTRFDLFWRTMVMRDFAFGVSAKHLSDDVSTTVSQKATTGSETFT